MSWLDDVSNVISGYDVNQWNKYFKPNTTAIRGLPQLSDIGYMDSVPNAVSQTSASGLSGGQWAGLGAATAGLIGSGVEMFGSKNSAFSREDIDKIINSIRSIGSRQIGSQLSRANIATAGNLASRGLGSSTITTGALQSNQAAALQALSNLESQLGLQRGQLEQFLAQLEEQKRREKLGFFGDVADIGIMALLGL